MQQITEFLTVREVAGILKLSPDSITRRFENYPGVLNLGTEENVRKKKRRYRTLRIPKDVLQRFIVEARVQ